MIQADRVVLLSSLQCMPQSRRVNRRRVALQATCEIFSSTPFDALKLSVRDVHPDGSRSRERALGARRSADCDELLNDDEEKLDAVLRNQSVALQPLE